MKKTLELNLGVGSVGWVIKNDETSQIEDLGAHILPQNKNKKIIKPFLKWAGGKTQLIGQISDNLPTDIFNEEFTYIEPFVGSGAVLFWMLNNFPNMEKAVINDINEDLINTYKTIASKPKELISALEILQNEFHSLDGNQEKKKEYYYEKRASLTVKIFSLSQMVGFL